MTRHRQRALNVRGNVALGAAIALGLFLLASVPSGGWASIHTWLAVALAALGVTALACFHLAGRQRPRMAVEDGSASTTDEVSIKGDSPQVTHPIAESSEAAIEVRK